MAGKNNYHYSASLDDSAETACGHMVGWLLAEQEEHTGDDKAKVLSDPNRCEDCESVLVEETS